MKRAIRRHHYRRLINNRKSYYGGCMDNPRHFGKAVSAPQCCSKVCCGVPRNLYGNGRAARTMQELRFECSLISED